MSTTNNSNAPLSLDTQIDEDRVRRALGLTPSGTTHQQRPEQARQRHRFVSDGAVPVVMLNRADSEVGTLRDKLATVESQLETERAQHASTRRQLADVQAAHQVLRTRYGHSELAHNEALATERDARRSAEETIASLRASLSERLAPVVRAVPVERPAPIERPAPVEPLAERSVAAVEPIVEKEPAAPRARKIRVSTGPAKEPKPVRWWTPSYRAKTKP